MTNTNDFDEQTTRIPLESMKALVFGAPSPRRVRFPARLVFVAALFGMMAGCATARPAAVETETVGNLSASYHSVAVAPVHVSTDLTPSFGAIDSDDDDTSSVATTVSTGEVVEAPAAVTKVAHGF